MPRIHDESNTNYQRKKIPCQRMVIAEHSVVGENPRMDSTVPDWPPAPGVLRWNAELRVYAPAPTRNAVASTVGMGTVRHGGT
jgi:hypothetical protein